MCFCCLLAVREIVLNNVRPLNDIMNNALIFILCSYETCVLQQKYFDSGDYNMAMQGRNRLLAQPSPLAPTPQSPQATNVSPVTLFFLPFIIS